jgi:hypothetical protein
MKITALKFEQSASERVYADYMHRIKKVTNILPKEDQQDVLMEFNSHIYEGLQVEMEKNEIDHLLDILDKLGAPEEVLKPLVADKKLEQATKTFNPIHVFKALILNLTNGISYAIFFILYLFLFGFVFLIYAKITNPEQVGLFFRGNDFLILGQTSLNMPENGVTELLGNWFIPMMILATVISYLIITLLLKLKRRFNASRI